MDINKSNIVEIAGAIINEAGIDALSVDALIKRIGISRNDLLIYLGADDDILKFMSLSLEDEIQQLIKNVAAMNLSPEKELENLFKSLYEFFGQKSYYLHVLFSSEITENDVAIQRVLQRIKHNVKAYLSTVLDRGKKIRVFNNKVETRYLVENILGRFRLFMSDQQLTNKMIRDLKLIRANKE
ncbi:TetR/AcrR family transcriptional regulator [Aquipluma nitroreducens]|uniref:TetR/AcrR family transcriptional regulator n=1 Tax=Aquipluma nitroreducens TaxID=2010828 RepID=UPI00296EAACE|nr:hypothetical protein [Aquipluma nitroreducens]